MTYNEERITKFREVYEKHLRVNVEMTPQTYLYGIDKVPSIVDKLVAGIKEHGATFVNKDSNTFRTTFAELGIRNTYRAFEAYLEGN